jgi:hypothetical protein
VEWSDVTRRVSHNELAAPKNAVVRSPIEDL